MRVHLRRPHVPLRAAGAPMQPLSQSLPVLPSVGRHGIKQWQLGNSWLSGKFAILKVYCRKTSKRLYLVQPPRRGVPSAKVRSPAQPGPADDRPARRSMPAHRFFLFSQLWWHFARDVEQSVNSKLFWHALKVMFVLKMWGFHFLVCAQ